MCTCISFPAGDMAINMAIKRCALHAAAPALLEACKEMYSWLCQEMPAQQPKGWEAEMMDKAQAAIAAATEVKDG